MKLTKEELQDLAECVKMAMAKEFESKHLSYNIVDTIQIETDSEDKVKVIIPAQTYNMYKFFMERVIVPSNRGGSYASKLNDEGSSFMVYWGTKKDPHRKFMEPRNHVGYIDRVIDDAINQWLVKHKEDWELKSRMEL